MLAAHRPVIRALPGSPSRLATRRNYPYYVFMQPFIVVIPARFASTRLPGKPLLDLCGAPMIVRVAEQGRLSGADEIWIATDHGGVAEAVTRAGFKVCMTREDHVSGTDRIAEVCAAQGFDDDAIVVNVQGDEPLIAPTLIRDVALHLRAHRAAAMATACHPIDDAAPMSDPNVVKVVLDANGDALYFSRAPIPYARDARAATPAFRHIGIYAYRVAFLKKFTQLAPAAIEQCEALEQLRALWHGYKIAVSVTHTPPAAGVDTAADLENARKAYMLKHLHPTQ